MNANWTKPYFGVSHLGSIHDRYSVTVVDRGSFAELDKYFPGCGFSPIEETYDNVNQAKAGGEKWLDQMNGKKAA